MSSSGRSKSARRRAAASAAASGALTGGSETDSSSPAAQPTKKRKEGESTEDVDVASDRVGGVPTPVGSDDEQDATKLDTIIQMLTKLQGRVDHQGSSISILTSTVTSMQDSFTKKLDEIEEKAAKEKHEIDNKLAKLQALVTSTASAATSNRAAPVSGGCASSASALAPRFPPVHADPHAASGSSPGPRPRPASQPPAVARDTNDYHKVLVIGFPRLLPKAALKNHYDRIMAAFAHSAEGNATGVFFGNTGTMYSIGFPTGRDVGTFLRWFRENRRTIRWKDPRAAAQHGDNPDDDVCFTDIVIKVPSPPEVRARGKRLSPYHKFLEAKLPLTPGMSLKTRPDKGTVCIETPDDLWTMFRIDPNDPETKIQIDEQALLHFGFSVAQVDKFVASLNAE
jgi:hypothetical protein